MQLRDGAPSSALLAAAALTLSQLASAFYLPGVAPTSYKPGDKVPLYVNTIKPIASPQDSMLHSVVSYDYYHPLFNMCGPENPESVSESLGSILFGDRIKTSVFELKMAKDLKCNPLCAKTYELGSAKFVNRKIEQGYSINWLVDGLPAGQMLPDGMTTSPEMAEPGVTYNNQGFALGQVDGTGVAQLNNHYNIIIDYHKVSGKEDQLRVVGVRVAPQSLNYGDSVPDCSPNHEPMMLSEDGDTNVKFSYTVKWVESPTVWATRWDKYLRVFDPKIHWFSLINSSVIVVVLVSTVMGILVRALRKDIARYNRLDSINLDDFSGADGGSVEDGVQEDSGWKLVHGDVFRTPSHPLLLSVFLGTGVQLFMMTGVTIVFAMLGFLSPSSRGSLATILVLSCTVLSAAGGYVSARVYKSFGGEKWKLNIALTPVLVPSIVFAVFFLLNLFLWAKQSSGAVPFGTMLVIVSIWFVVSVPLSVGGSFLGFRHAALEPPVRTNQIPRQIPPAAGYLRPIPSMLLVGLLPFVVIFVELYFIMSSIWFSRIYYMFGFLFLCFGLMAVTTASVAILMVYFLLCSEDYHWQWRSFFAAGTSAFYIFGHAMIYWIGSLSLAGFAGSVVYLGYSMLIAFLFFILSGSIGFFASWWFTRKIYASIKID
ncbi:hypothetical protein RB601_002889 [Gaeumannomyces tritici]